MCVRLKTTKPKSRRRKDLLLRAKRTPRDLSQSSIIGKSLKDICIFMKELEEESSR